uniref:Uncharacterized protein n=1 Tax=Eutreptiella gymnastica TaxID=73025 RepID=A0A7S4CNZ5_9EUGL
MSRKNSSLLTQPLFPNTKGSHPASTDHFLKLSPFCQLCSPSRPFTFASPEHTLVALPLPYVSSMAKHAPPLRRPFITGKKLLPCSALPQTDYCTPQWFVVYPQANGWDKPPGVPWSLSDWF